MVLGIYSVKDGESIKWNEQHLYGSNRLGMWNWDTVVPASAPVVGGGTYLYDSLLLGSRTYELSNHLGNVLATISDKKIGNDSSGVVNYYTSEVLLQNDYYPFGMLQPARKYNAGDLYRYGFSGKENDNEIKADGNQQDYGSRIYDPRVGKFLSVDPISSSYPWNSPYSYAEGDVLRAIDLDGLEKVIVHTVSFAPWNYFASDFWGTYSGDGSNRKFGDNFTKTVENNTTYVNFRIRSECALDLATMTQTSRDPIGAVAHYHSYFKRVPFIPLARQADVFVFSPATFQEFYTGYVQGYPKTTLYLIYHLRGANKAAALGVTADIDVNVDMNFWKLTDNEIGVTGTVSGDRFPANENYLTDEKNNKLMLGVSGVGSENKTMGPYTELPGDNKREMQKWYFTILFNDDKSFKGVRTSNGKVYTLEEWNKQFTNLDPKSSQTGTNVNGNTVEADNVKKDFR
jgi:RHS repeat-associated protein